MDEPIFDIVTPYPTIEELDALLNNREVIEATADKILSDVFGISEEEQIQRVLDRR